MVRVFTTHFEFYGKTYSTLVRLSESKQDFTLQIQVPDASLYHLLPDGQVVYSSASGLKLSHGKEKLLSQELVGCIVRSVEPHLEA